MSTGSVVGSRQRALEGRVTVLERELEEMRDEVRATVAHLAFLTENLDALRADKRRSDALVIRNDVSEAGHAR